jgi:ribonuclease D
MPDLEQRMITTAEQLTECCTYLASCPEIGLDTEFVGEETYHPHLCLVQVATREKLLLIDPLTAGPLQQFWQLLVDPRRTVVVHAGREEVRLCQLHHGQTPVNLFDLQLAAGLVGMTYPLGHGNLVGQLLGVSLQKRETLTEWRERPLSREQIDYAYDDVRYLLPLWDKLAAELKQLNRLDWAREEFERMTHAPVAEETGQVEKWRRLKGMGSLSRRQLGMVRELFAWREEVAERTNRPPRSLARDDLLIEIVRRNPTRERDLQMVRGLPRRDLPAILRVLERARALPLEHLPSASERIQDPPKVALLGGVLQAVLGDLAVRKRLAPNLVASSNDVKDLIRARLRGQTVPEDSPFLGGWRAAHVLPELLAVLDGRRFLRIVDLQQESPFAVEELPGAFEPRAT